MVALAGKIAAGNDLTQALSLGDSLLSADIHDNASAPIGLLNQLRMELLASLWSLAVRLLIELSTSVEIGAGKLYIHNDMKRLFADH